MIKYQKFFLIKSPKRPLSSKQKPPLLLLMILSNKLGNVSEASLLIHSEQLHTTKGYHITQIKLWEEWATDKVKQISATLKFKDAMSQIAKFCKDTELEFFE